MVKLIFWFSSNNRLEYWFEYTRKNFGEDICVKYNKAKHLLNIRNMYEIYFKNDKDINNHIGIHNTNQYWVEDLFDNNFEEFFYQILRDNLEEIPEEKLYIKLYTTEYMCKPFKMEKTNRKNK